MSYWNEFRRGWRPLLATALGMGTGFSATGVITSIMAPHFIQDLGWTPAAFAKVGAVSILMSLFIPIAGRMVDVWDVRRTAAIGIVSLPLCMVALSRMTGDISQYYIIFAIQAALCVTTTATVYSRVIVANFVRARGLAMAIAASAPGVTGIFAGYFLSNYVNESGWRNGYILTAILTFICGVIALALLPSSRKNTQADEGEKLIKAPSQRSWADYAIIFRTPAFWILILAMVFCNLYQTLIIAQISMLISANGVDKLNVGGIISAFSVAMVIGRFVCGAAIDRLPGQMVAAVGMGMPAIGMFMLASSVDTPGMVLVAMIFIGLAVGAEGDLIGVLIARAFGVAIYGSVMGMVTGAISLATASGAFLLSIMLAKYGNYDHFLTLCASVTVVGAAMLLLLPKNATAAPVEHAP